MPLSSECPANAHGDLFSGAAVAVLHLHGSHKGHVVNSKQKGKRGELELAEVLREHGYIARRGVQYSGGPGSPDVIAEGLEDVHLECKRTETLRLDAWMEQAKRDAAGKLPVVAYRHNRGEWLAIMPLSRFLDLMLTVGKDDNESND